MSLCIICDREHEDKTLEHIIPRSIGNIHYILPKGLVCSKCNHRFSKYENRVLSSEAFLKQRSRLKILKTKSETKAYKASPFDQQVFLSKMAYEGIFKSRPWLMKEFDLRPIKSFLAGGQAPVVFEDEDLQEIAVQKSIPKWINAFRLRNSKIWLSYLITTDRRLFVQFQIGNTSLSCRMS